MYNLEFQIELWKESTVIFIVSVQVLQTKHGEIMCCDLEDWVQWIED